MFTITNPILANVICLLSTNSIHNLCTYRNKTEIPGLNKTTIKANTSPSHTPSLTWQ